MTTPSLSYHELKALNPCTKDFKRVIRALGGATKWDGKKIDAKRARKLGATFGDIIWAASAVARINPDVERRGRLWLADCAARVLHFYEAYSSADNRPRNAIIASRAYARGEIDAAASDDAGAAACSAACVAVGAAVKGAAGAAASAAGAAASAAACAAARVTVWAAVSDAAGAAARGVPWATASDAACAVARAAEEAWQFDALVARLSDPEPEDVPLPARSKNLGIE